MLLKDVPSKRPKLGPPGPGSKSGSGQSWRPAPCVSPSMASRGRQRDKEMGQTWGVSRPHVSAFSDNTSGLGDPPPQRSRSLCSVRFNSSVLSEEINYRTRPTSRVGSGPLPNILSGAQETTRAVEGLSGRASHQRGASLRALQDGRSSHGQIFTPSRRLSDIAGYQRRVSSPVDCSFGSTVPSFHLGRSSLSVSSGVLWPGASTAHFHETASASRSDSQSERHSVCNLSRRPDLDQPVARVVSHPNTVGSRFINPSGFSHQSEIRSGTFKDSRFLGDDDRHAQNGTACSVEQGQELSRLGEENTACAGRVSSDSSPARRSHRQDFSHDTSSASGAAIISRTPFRQKPRARQVLRKEASMGFNGQPPTGSPVRAGAMASHSSVLERPLNYSAQPRSRSPHNGCESPRLGRVVEEPRLQGFLDSPGGRAQQQRARADGDGSFCASVEAALRGQDAGDSHRQHDDDGIHQSPGWSESFVDGDSSPLVGMGTPYENHHFRDVHRRQDERESRSTVARATRPVGLDAEQENLSEDQPEVGSFHDGHVRDAPQCAASTFLFVASGTSSNGSGCVSAGSQEGTGLCKSSVQFDRQVLVATQAAAGDVRLDSPGVAVTTVVADAGRDDYRGANSSSSSQRSVPPGQPGERSADGPSEVARDRGACLRRALIDDGVSAAMAQGLCDQWRLPTQKGYNSYWLRWFDFCAARGSSAVRASPLVIGEFLTKLSAGGASGSAVNSARSAIVGIVQCVTGDRKIAKHPLLAGVTKTAKLLRPVKAKYDTIWDIGLVLAYWKRTPATTLVLKRAKAISLFILSVFARPSDCERLSMASGHFGIVQSQNSYMYRIRGPKESKSATKLTSELFLPFLDEASQDIDVCPARAMVVYGDAVDDALRIPCASTAQPTGFFVSEVLRSVPPVSGNFFTPLSAQRISKIMKGVMTLAGVDTTVFTGGSGRHAGSSAAADKNVPFEQILLTGRWSSFQVWNKFYNRAKLNAHTRKVLEEQTVPTAASASAACD